MPCDSHTVLGLQCGGPDFIHTYLRRARGGAPGRDDPAFGADPGGGVALGRLLGCVLHGVPGDCAGGDALQLGGVCGAPSVADGGREIGELIILAFRRASRQPHVQRAPGQLAASTLSANSANVDLGVNGAPCTACTAADDGYVQPSQAIT